MLDNVVHEEINLEPVELTPRSRLIRPKIFGLGTQHVESLISYIVRIAAAHHVSPMRMMKKVYGLENPDIAECMYPSFFNHYASTLNGLGKYAQMFVTETENLTGSTQLQLTTLLPLANLLPVTGCGLLSDRPKWCPECVQEMLIEFGQAYRPLIWSLKLYKACTKHKSALVGACPHCERVQPFIMHYPDLSRCAYCYQDLNVRVETEDVEFSEFDYWIFLGLEDLITNLPALELASSSALTLFIKEAVQHLKTNASNLCKQMGLSSWALKGWLNKGEKPSLPQLLSVCYGMDVLPNEIFLKGESLFKDSQLSLRELPDKIVNRAERPLLKPSQKKVLQHALQQCVHDQNDHRPLSQIASSVYQSPSCLRYWFPKECDQISAKHAEHKRNSGATNQQASIAMVEAIVNELKLNGEYVSNRKVNDRLLQQGKTLAKPVLYRAFKLLRNKHS